jgi:hypothetical protein
VRICYQYVKQNHWDMLRLNKRKFNLNEFH